jgi:two-component system phosphate regulon sensor histidine kinase PhoR
MKKSIFLKVFGCYVVIILAISALILTFSFSTIRRHYEGTLAQELENLGRALNVNIHSFLEDGRTRELDAFLKKVAKEIQARITVIDPQGVVLGDSERDPALMENHRYRPEVQEALQGKIGRSLRFSDTIQEKMLYVGLPVKLNGRILGVLRLSLFMKNVEVLLHGLRTNIGRAVLIVAACSLVLAFLLSLHFTRPILGLTKAARQVAGGNFRARVSIRQRDEFRDLAAAFNLMTERIEQLFEDVSRRKESLSNIVASIQEGLVVLDRDGRVTLANDSLKKLIGEDFPEGKFYWEIIRNPKILKFIGRLSVERKSLSEEIRIDDRYVLATASSLGKDEGLILTLHDFTELKNAENMKKDFIINASHELRTPISAIAGAVETLKDEDSCANKTVLEILKRHTERLRNIVEDLLKLSELEDREYKFDIQDVDIGRVAENVLQIFSSRIKDKGLSAELRAAANPPRLRADPFQIEQMLINLVDNAVKYTDRGKIEIGLRTENGYYVIEVKDTGPGIPSQHLPRIFERFYVADKSRSRKLGGTGLGLSIIKHIVQLHHGSISVQSAEGQGTIFTVRLPL